MAQKRVQRLVISAMPWKDGLLTAGRQATITETALWEAANTTAELDGLLTKRPGLRQWGQTIKVPGAGTLTAFSNFLTGTAGYVAADSSAGLITHSTPEGALQTNVEAGSGSEAYKLSYAVGALSAATTWSLRFMFRGTNLPEYTATDTLANTFAFRGIGAAGSGKEFAVWAGGIYYKLDSDDTYALVADSENAGTGGWVCIEVRVDSAGDTEVYLNDVLLETITSSTLKSVTPTATSAFEFEWTVENSGAASTQYATGLATVMYCDLVDDPFEAVPLVAVTGFQYITSAGSQRRALLLAAGNYIYHDNGLFGAWRPLHPKQHSRVSFATFRRTMLWSDNDGGGLANLWQWDGFNEPDLLDDAPPMRFVSEHQQRVWGAGDRSNPLRLYYSGDRQPNLWFSPSETNVDDQFDAVLQAGYLEVPSKRGDEITCIFGDYYGDLCVFTRTGVYKVSGFGPQSYALAAVSQDVGCENEYCVTQVGNDLWFLGRQGIHSLSTTEQFGDVQVQFPSAAIQNLWSSNPSSVQFINREFLSEARLDYNPQQGLVYAAIPLTGESAAESIMVHNVNTQQWLGPWVIDSRAMANVEIATPVVEVMMHGGLAGQVGYTDETYKADIGDAEYTMTVRSARFTGRSLDPRLVGMTKTWKLLRLLVLPRGNWNMSVAWQVDGLEPRDPKIVSQNVFNRQSLCDDDLAVGDFRLDHDRLVSREQLGVIEIPIDEHGLSMEFTITQSGAGHDLALRGVEIEFSAAGYEAP